MIANGGHGPRRSMRRLCVESGNWGRDTTACFIVYSHFVESKLRKHWQNTMTTDLKTNYDAERNTSDVEKVKNRR